MVSSVRIGTSGWHYPHWVGVFYPADLPAREWLAFYARHFDGVEVNSSFYRLPSLAVLRRWYDATPPHFLFALKASRYLTHMKKLREPGPGIAALEEALRALKGKRGPVLFQLPPRWRCDPERLRDFLESWPRSIPAAFELRDPDWHNGAILGLLREYRVAYCIYDLGGFASPLHVTADFVYVRLHGPGAPYCGCYGHEQLSRWAERVRAWSETMSVYVYFDNDEAGYAVRNALALKELLA